MHILIPASCEHIFDPDLDHAPEYQFVDHNHLLVALVDPLLHIDPGIGVELLKLRFPGYGEYTEDRMDRGDLDLRIVYKG